MRWPIGPELVEFGLGAVDIAVAQRIRRLVEADVEHAATSSNDVQIAVVSLRSVHLFRCMDLGLRT